MSNELVKPNGKDNDPVKALSQYLNARSKNLASFAASRTKPETLIRLAVFEFSRSEWLRKCRVETIYAALILAAQVGLEPSGIRGECYLVPFKGECTLIPGWRGLVKLALRSKAVKSLYSHVVYERDTFRVQLGTDVKIDHVPHLDGDAGEIIAAYAVAKLENGGVDVEVMTRSELDYIQKMASKGRGGKDGPAYEDWQDQMFRKAPIRRLAKRLPLGDDFFLASKVDELTEAGEPERIRDYIDITPGEDGSGPALQDAIAEKLAEKAATVREGR